MIIDGLANAWNLTQELLLSNGGSMLSLTMRESTLTGAGGIPETGTFVTVIIVISAIYIIIRGRFNKNNLNKKMDDSV